MTSPAVKAGDWIKIKSDEKDTGIDGCVFEVLFEGEVSIGYYQDSTRTVKEEVVWNGTHWKFKYEGLVGSGTRNRKAVIDGFALRFDRSNAARRPFWLKPGIGRSIEEEIPVTPHHQPGSGGGECCAGDEIRHRTRPNRKP